MFIGLGNLPACNGGPNYATGHLYMVPYLPDFLSDSQLNRKRKDDCQYVKYAHDEVLYIIS